MSQSGDHKHLAAQHKIIAQQAGMKPSRQHGESTNCPQGRRLADPLRTEIGVASTRPLLPQVSVADRHRHRGRQGRAALDAEEQRLDASCCRRAPDRRGDPGLKHY
jgi:hypothetical protein